MLWIFLFSLRVVKKRAHLRKLLIYTYLVLTVGFFGGTYIRFHPLIREWVPYYHYLYIAENTFFRRVPRSLIPELEKVVTFLEPGLVKVKGLNFYQEFKTNHMIRLHQISANDTDITDDELYYLRKYEMAFSHKKSTRKQSGMIKKPPFIKRLAGKNVEEWIQTSGHFSFNRKLYSNKNSIYSKFKASHGILITGYFYYPPGGFREWHTNENDIIGWRLYYIKREEPNRSWFLWRNPITGKFNRENDCNDCYNMFKIRSKEEGALWHSVYSDTHRFSIGMNIPEWLVSRITRRIEEGNYD